MQLQLSQYFTKEDVTHSDTALRLQIDNSLPDNLIENVNFSCHQLSLARLHVNLPFLVTSWYRCPDLNQAIGSRQTSDHIKGLAIDFKCPDLGTPLQVCKGLLQFAEDTPTFFWDQIIHEFGHWCHVSFSAEDKRRKELWTYFPDGTHSKGLLEV